MSDLPDVFVWVDTFREWFMEQPDVTPKHTSASVPLSNGLTQEMLYAAMDTSFLCDHARREDQSRRARNGDS